MELWRISSYSGANNNCVEVGWRTSSFSGPSNNCVEVGWRKSSRSGTQSDCVEVGFAVEAVAVRDTKDRDGAQLAFDPPRWQAFLTTIKQGTHTH